jgi:hypothetical protein
LIPQHKAWQREVKACWDRLVAGDYDWSHLAMRLWPERVVPKCAEDVSLAIAHGLEELLWDKYVEANGNGPDVEPDGQIAFGDDDEEEEKPKRATKRAKGRPRWTLKPTVNQKLIDQLVGERTNDNVKAALKYLLDAPMPGGKAPSKPSASKGPKRAKKAEAEGLF